MSPSNIFDHPHNEGIAKETGNESCERCTYISSSHKMRMDVYAVNATQSVGERLSDTITQRLPIDRRVTTTHNVKIYSELNPRVSGGRNASEHASTHHIYIHYALRS